MTTPALPERAPDSMTHAPISRRRFLGLSATALAGLGGIVALGATSSAHDGHETTSGTPAATPAGTPVGTPVATDLLVTVSAHDIRFEPKELRIPAGVEVTLLFANEGVMPHDLVIPSLNVNSGRINGGDSVNLTITAPAGSHMFYCSVAGHKQAGMVGALIAE